MVEKAIIPEGQFWRTPLNCDDISGTALIKTEQMLKVTANINWFRHMTCPSFELCWLLLITMASTTQKRYVST